MVERIAIQSTKTNIGIVEGFISDICDDYHVGNYFSSISVAVLHAVENAIVHGNGEDPSKKVTLSCGRCAGGMFFEVEDEGSGFASDCFGEFPLEGRGQGIFLMKTLSDVLEYSEGGRKVRMEFDINGIEASDSMERRSALQKFRVARMVEV